MTMTYDLAVADARRNGDRPLVVVERDGAHAIVTLDDPEKLNPLSAALTIQLNDQLIALARDPELRAVVLTGRDPAFSAGGDLRRQPHRAPAFPRQAPLTRSSEPRRRLRRSTGRA